VGQRSRDGARFGGFNGRHGSQENAMSTQAATAARRPFIVHADSCGRFHVLRAGEPTVETPATLREAVERNAAELRRQAMDESAVLVAGWSRSMALLCAAVLRDLSGKKRSREGQLLKATTS
jgi:molybdate-binding protein